MKTEDIRKIILEQATSQRVELEASHLATVTNDVAQIVDKIPPYTDWHLKNGIQAELTLKIRAIMDKSELPLAGVITDAILAKAKMASTNPKSYWFVGASWGKAAGDQTDRFIKEGIWQNGNDNKYLDMVRSMKAGDLIAIKSSYTRKHNLPFDNGGQSVSAMGIKVIGVITKNHGDGQTVDVDWSPKNETPREWYFYTNRSTIWRLTPDRWEAKGLIDFTFNDISQELDRFRNAPFWQERFGDTPVETKRFHWTKFYEAIAQALLKHKDDRSGLTKFINELAEKLDLSYIKDKGQTDICPFTTMGTFNRGITDENRKAVAKELADFLDVKEAVPDSFEGVPILNNQKSWFFGFEDRREDGDIERLWGFFEKALNFADKDDADAKDEFLSGYDIVSQQYGVGWNLSMGLYWMRPWNFPTLDDQSQRYIKKKLGIEIGKNGPKRRCSGKDYLAILDELELRFQEHAYPVHSFPELSLAAWLYKDTGTPAHPNPTDPDLDQEVEDESEPAVAPIDPYTLEDIIKDGCFLEKDNLSAILERLRNKKNLILQGPPGTGKTWLAKKLAFALIGHKSDNKIRAVQFHPNLSYEDFVRGWRPAGEGRLALVDGPFLETINQAKKDAANKHVIVIEEINRGNPAQIFGEMLTLLEADKRTPAEALELSNRRSDSERVFVPDNLYVIGTMNIADRSLALVDLALRRRFALIDLKPTFGDPWKKWVHEKSGIDMGVLQNIEERLIALNTEIENDQNLGPQFKIGHSYVTPAFNAKITDALNWYRNVIQTEIGPLLDEYWFDDLDRSQSAKSKLLAGL